MSAVEVQLLVSVITFVISVGSAMFVAGTRWGRIETDIKNLKEGDLRVISDRLARIEGMFTLTLKEPDSKAKE